MQSTTEQPIVQTVQGRDTGGFLGHPKGLTPLFLTEMWERFSYYGMRALLILFMVAPVENGGLGFDTKRAASIYGTYTMSVYLLGLPGGFLADKILGARFAVLLGGIIIAIGHFSMAYPSLPSFYAGLVLIACGTGLLKPNISSMVGSLYREDDPRRDGGFSIFYMGINSGAFAAPLICGYLAQSDSWKHRLSSMGFSPESSWHWGFAAAGVGMIFGLIQYLAHRKRLAHVGNRSQGRKAVSNAADVAPLTRDEWKRVGAIVVLFVFSVLFWSIYEQAGSSFNLFADTLTRCEIFGWKFPSSYFQSLPALFVVFILAPLFSWLWVRLGSREPSSPAKFAYGLFFVAISVLLLVPASMFAASGRVSPLWLVAVYFVSVIGEMCLSPVGLSTVTKLAPPRLAGIMMGVWFLSIAIGDKVAGYVAGFFTGTDTALLQRLFGYMGVALLISTGVLIALTPWIRRLMGKVH
jgi:POT family proton-dependent oligopeptide transporter